MGMALHDVFLHGSQLIFDVALSWADIGCNRFAKQIQQHRWAVTIYWCPEELQSTDAWNRNRLSIIQSLPQSSLMFIHSFINLLIHSFVHVMSFHSCIVSFFIHFMHSVVQSAFIHACIHSFIHSLIHSCIYSLIPSFMHAFISFVD